jgi:hypothetical protein
MVAPEPLEELQVGVPDVLDVVTVGALDVADVAGVEVRRHRLRAGSEHPHLRRAFDEVHPFVGIGVPVQLAQRAGARGDECRGDGFRNMEVAAVGDLHRPSGRLARKGLALQRKGKGVFRRPFGTQRGCLIVAERPR